MNLNTLIIILGAAIAIVPSVKMIRDRKFFSYNLTIIVLGLILVITSIVNDKRNDFEQKIKDTKIISLQGSVDSANNLLRSIAKNDSIFMENLKDSGYMRQGNSVINNNSQDYSTTTTYNNNTTNLPIRIPEIKEPVTDETNFTYKLVDNKLHIAPKEGAWTSPYFQFENKNRTINKNITDDNEVPWDDSNIEEVYIGKTKYSVISISQLKRAIINKNPLILDLSGNPNQFIIFGDWNRPTKRYLYQNGKVFWFPNKEGV